MATGTKPTLADLLAEVQAMRQETADANARAVAAEKRLAAAPVPAVTRFAIDNPPEPLGFDGAIFKGKSDKVIERITGMIPDGPFVALILPIADGFGYARPNGRTGVVDKRVHGMIGGRAGRSITTYELGRSPTTQNPLRCHAWVGEYLPPRDQITVDPKTVNTRTVQSGPSANWNVDD